MQRYDARDIEGSIARFRVAAVLVRRSLEADKTVGRVAADLGSIPDLAELGM